MATISFAEGTMSLNDIARKIQSLKKEVTNLRKRVREMAKKANGQDWVSQIAQDPERCEIEEIGGELLAEMDELVSALESKQTQAFKDYERYVLLREQFKKRCEIVICILEQMERGVSTHSIADKLGRIFGGEHRWKATVGNCLLNEICNYFDNPTSQDAKTKLIKELQKVKNDIAPESVEGEEKSQGFQNLQQMEERIERVKEELTWIPAFYLEVYRMHTNVKANLRKLFP